MVSMVVALPTHSNSTSYTMLLLKSIFRATVVLALEIILASASPIYNAVDSDPIVQTPAGPVSKSITHQIPAGSYIQHSASDSTVSIVASNGTTLHRFPITQNGTKLTPGNVASSISRRAMSNGYVASSYWGNVDPSPLKYFSTSWQVPSVPQNVDGQTLFIFNGLEPNSCDAILQPVLQFGGGSAAGGGNYWAVASWFVAPSGVFYTPLTTMYPGQILNGVMTLLRTQTSGNVTTYTYNSIFTALPKSSLNISTTEQLTTAFEALEIYGASGPTDLPYGETAMRNINLFEQNGQRPSMSWIPWTVGNNEGFEVSIAKDGSTNGEVDLIYPLQ